MLSDNLQTLLSLLGLILAAVGLPILIAQIRELQRSVRSAAHAAIYEQAADFRSHLVAHPHLRRYFFDGAEIARDHEDYDRVATIAELFLNYLEHITVTADSFGRHNRAALERFTRGALLRSPVLRQQLHENGDLYSDALRRFLPESDRAVDRSVVRQNESESPRPDPEAQTA